MDDDLEALRAELHARAAALRKRRLAREAAADPDFIARVEAAEQAIAALRTGLTSAFIAADVETPEEIRPARTRLELLKGGLAS